MGPKGEQHMHSSMQPRFVKSSNDFCKSILQKCLIPQKQIVTFHKNEQKSPRSTLECSIMKHIIVDEQCVMDDHKLSCN